MYAQEFMQEHTITDCLYAHGMRDAAEAIDTMILDDRDPAVINTIALEAVVRQCYAFEVGFTPVRQKSDWLKPQQAAQGWKSKVDFEIIQRINPKAGDPRRELVRSAETWKSGPNSSATLSSRRFGQMVDSLFQTPSTARLSERCWGGAGECGLILTSGEAGSVLDSLVHAPA